VKQFWAEIYGPNFLKDCDRCYDFKNIFAEKFNEKTVVFDSKQSHILKKIIITLVFKKNTNISPKIGKKSRKFVILTSTPGYGEPQTGSF
jgi:hypothetical protein